MGATIQVLCQMLHKPDRSTLGGRNPCSRNYSGGLNSAEPLEEEKFSGKDGQGNFEDYEENEDSDLVKAARLGRGPRSHGNP